MNYTDDQLKQLLAKLSGNAAGVRFDVRLESEYLHLCSLVEAGLTIAEHNTYRAAIYSVVQNPRDCFSATWQQRTRALAEVKGVTL